MKKINYVDIPFFVPDAADESLDAALSKCNFEIFKIIASVTAIFFVCCLLNGFNYLR